MKFVRLPLVVLASTGVPACMPRATMPDTAAPTVSPRQGEPFDATWAAVAAGESVSSSSKPRQQLAWGIEFTGDNARFFECDSETECSDRAVEVSARAVLAIRKVGRATPTRCDGRPASEVDVMRLTLSDGVFVSRGGAVMDDTRGIVRSTPSAPQTAPATSK